MTAWIEEIDERHTRAVHGGPGPGGPDADVLDFSVNVNPFGPCPAAADAWRRADPVGYPDPASLEARRAAASLWGVPLTAVRFGAGATELLHRAALAWLAPGRVGVVPEPCFAEYARAVALARGRVVTVPPADADGRLDLDGVIAAARTHRAGIVYLGRPSTPTGESVPRDDLLRIRAALPSDCLLVLDESFVSFDAGSVAAPPVLGIREGVLSVRSVTKDCGLAGLRAGFATGPERLMRTLDRASLPWSASAPAQRAAAASLGADGAAWLDATIRRVREELRVLADAAGRIGRVGIEPRANFVCVRVGVDASAGLPPRAGSAAGGAPTLSASALVEALRGRGLRVRSCASFGLTDHVRIGVRRPEENRTLARALEAIACP